MVRGRSLSDERVISFINQNLIAVDLNCNYGFPSATPALEPFRQFYEEHHTPGQGQGTAEFSRGFTKSIVMTPDGSMRLSATPSAIITDDWRYNPNYNPDGYLEFLKAGQRNWMTMQSRQVWARGERM
jgi:hypothetical protein